MAEGTTYRENIVVDVDDRTGAAMTTISRQFDRAVSSVRKFGDTVRLVAKPVSIPINIVTTGAQAAIKAVQGSLDGLRKAWSGIQQFGMAGLGVTALQNLASAAGEFVGIPMQAQLQDLSAQFQVFTGDAQTAADLVESLRTRAFTRPFRTVELASAAAALMPTVKSTKSGLTDLLDLSERLAVAKPEQGLEGAAYALREAMSGDYTSLAERFEVSRGAINKYKAQGLPALQVIDKALKDAGITEGLVAAKTTTMTGRWQAVTRQLDRVQAEIAKPIFPPLMQALTDFQGLLADQMPMFKTWGNALGNFFKTVIDLGRQAASVLGPILGAAFGNLVAILGAASGALQGDFMLLGQSLISMNPKVKSFVLPLIDIIGSLGRLLRRVLPIAISLASNAFGWLLDRAKELGDWLGPKLAGGGAKVASMLDDLGGFATKVWTKFQPFIEGLRARFAPILERVKGLVQGLTDILGKAIGGDFAGAWEDIQQAMAPFAPTGERIQRAIGAIVGWLKELTKQMDGVSGEATNAINPLQTVADITNALSGALDSVVTSIASFIDWLNKTPAAQAALSAIVGAILAAVIAWKAYAVVMGVVAVAQAIATAAATPMILPLLLIAAAIGAVVAILIYAYTHWDGFRAVVDTVAGALGNLAQTVLPVVGAQMSKWMTDLGAEFSRLGSLAQAVWPFIALQLRIFAAVVQAIWYVQIKPIFDLIGWIWTTVQKNWEASGGDLVTFMTGLAHDIIDGLRYGLVDYLTNLWATIKTEIIDPLIQMFKDAFGIQSPSTVFAEMGLNIMKGLAGGLTSGIGEVTGALGDIATKIKDGLGSAIGGVGSTVSGAVSGAASSVGNAAQGITSGIAGAANPNATNAEVEAYIRQAAQQRGIDPNIALRVAQGEGGTDVARRGTFSTGSSWWPFQLHYGGKGTPYEQYGDVAGMGNSFTAKTGFQPGDPSAWQAATDYALDAAKSGGWGAWYGAKAAGITGMQGINSYDQGGMLPTGLSLAYNGTGSPEPVGAGAGAQITLEAGAIQVNVSGGASGSLVDQLRSALPGIADELMSLIAERLDASAANRPAPA